MKTIKDLEEKINGLKQEILSLKDKVSQLENENTSKRSKIRGC